MEGREQQLLVGPQNQNLQTVLTEPVHFVQVLSSKQPVQTRSSEERVGNDLCFQEGQNDTLQYLSGVWAGRYGSALLILQTILTTTVHFVIQQNK